MKIGYTKHSDTSWFREMRSYDPYDYPLPPDYVAQSLYIDTEAYSIPVNVYYAYAANKKWKFSISAGFSVLTNKISAYGKMTNYEQQSVYDPEWGGNVRKYVPVSSVTSEVNSKTDTVIMPTASIGIEYKIFSFLGLYTDVGYNMGGKTKYETIEQDFSGFSITFLGLKVYLP